MGNDMKINKMVMERNYGLMVQNLLDLIIWERNMDMVILIGLMGQVMKENFRTMIFMEKVFIHGVMVENMMEIGKIIKWIEVVYLVGLMVDHIKENI